MIKSDFTATHTRVVVDAENNGLAIIGMNDADDRSIVRLSVEDATEAVIEALTLFQVIRAAQERPPAIGLQPAAPTVVADLIVPAMDPVTGAPLLVIDVGAARL